MDPEFISAQEMRERLHQGWDEWAALLADLPQPRMTEPGIEGHWSIKDIIAHITWYEREMVTVLRTRVFKGSEWWDLSTTERNQKIFEQNRDRALEDVLDEHRRVHRELVVEAEKLTDEDLNDPSRIAEMPPGWRLSQILAGNTTTHYPDHIQSIRQGLKG